MSFLLKPDDPSDYRKLLTQCFVVVSDNAPPLSAYHLDRRWSQHEIVRRTIETIICEMSKPSNLICSGYDKHTRSSPIVELLTRSAWVLLLRRVGDGVMVYLLKYSSIFLSLPRNKHCQVAGFSISDLYPKFSKQLESGYHHSSPKLGSRKKRKRVGEVDSMHCRKMCCQKSLSEEATVTTATGNANNEGDSNGKCQESSNQITTKSRKRLREFSWQRHRKRKQLNFQETYSPTPCTRNLSNRDSVSGGLKYGFDTGLDLDPKKMSLHCSCCLVLQTVQKVTKNAQINRQSMFYKLECSSSVIPRKHILNSLKPNFSGADVLFKDIFRLSDTNITAQSMPCFHSNECCLIKSTCLYHSLVRLLKNFIRKAQSCRHLRFLDKHCAIPSLNQTANGSADSMLEDNEFEINSLEQGHNGVQLEGKLPHEKFHVFHTTICKRTLENTNHQFEPSQSYCQEKQVVSFIWAVCRSIVPPDLLGAPSNWRILRRNISRFVRLRRFEKFSLKQCMHKLKISRFPLLSTKHSSCYLSNHVLNYRKGQSLYVHEGCSEVNDAIHTVKHNILESWIFWFFSCLVVPLVQANFYVTESEFGKQNVFFYRKSIWEKLMNGAITCLKEQSYRLLDTASVRKIISKRSFGFSKVRLRPKENGVRVLANLKATSRMPVKVSSLKVQACALERKIPSHTKLIKYSHFKSVNCVLHNLHVVLKGLQMKDPEKLGSSVFDYNDVYRKLCPFLSVLKGGSTTMPGVFIVVSDVSKAFDTINQDKLLSVMKDVILNDEYLLKKSDQVLCTKKSLWLHQNLILADQYTNVESIKFTSFVPNCSLHSVVVNQERSRIITKQELYFYLSEHVKHNVLQLDKKFYLQDVGIPQGSVLSSLLCSFYYGHLENNVIYPFLEKTSETAAEDLSGRHNHHDASTAFKTSKDEIILSSPKCILLRFIDDFLFISTSKKQADRFFSRLQRGFREYNCYMNEEKFGLNFNVDQLSGLSSKRVYVGEDGITFLRWSGLFINCCTLEVQADYTRYLNTHLSSTLTICWQGKPGHHLKAKLCDYLRPKCHPLFYDSNINSAAVVRLNIYQAFLLCAMKFHCYIFDLSSICRLSTKSYIDTIERSIRFMHKLMKKRMHCMDCDSDIHPIFAVEKGEVQWLGLIAYIRVLKRKQSRHKELLSLLRSKLMAHRKAESVSSMLQYAVDDSHSSLIWKIKY
ncbi:hypothetical protein F0562_014504 [Nyssa sinensis]|uniref:Telomerase reverse transcriptase n=1 Tax=Nyssa sinensis TaxID=561372 RepID=A0A5J4ZRA6_9ASTE|nr:hypothetical protein F0562_014504 [Nyssa sinensis]